MILKIIININNKLSQNNKQFCLNLQVKNQFPNTVPYFTTVLHYPEHLMLFLQYEYLQQDFVSAPLLLSHFFRILFLKAEQSEVI